MQETINDLQSKLSFHEHTLSELNEVLVGQQQQIDKLNLHLKILQDRLEGIEHTIPNTQQDEKPPHY
jgi:SlyX protein